METGCFLFINKYDATVADTPEIALKDKTPMINRKETDVNIPATMTF